MATVLNSRMASDDLDRWNSFSDRLLKQATTLVEKFSSNLDSYAVDDYRILILQGLCRTMSCHRGVMLTAQSSLIVEAQILCRACFENLFTVTNLSEKKQEYVRLMHSDEIRSHQSTAEFIANDPGLTFKEGEHLRPYVRAFAQRLKSFLPKPNFLDPKTSLKDSSIRSAYLVYRMLSAKAGHPSITALRRYLLLMGGTKKAVVVNPAVRPDEVVEVVRLSNNALLGACVAVNQIYNDANVNIELEKIFEEFDQMAGSLTMTMNVPGA